MSNIKFPAQMIVKAEAAQQGHYLLGPYIVKSLDDTKKVMTKLSEHYNEGKIVEFYLVNSDNTWVV
jgi:hypothetical protein